jgi:hypothetical protein
MRRESRRIDDISVLCTNKKFTAWFLLDKKRPIKEVWVLTQGINPPTSHHILIDYEVKEKREAETLFWSPRMILNYTMKKKFNGYSEARYTELQNNIEFLTNSWAYCG